MAEDNPPSILGRPCDARDMGNQVSGTAEIFGCGDLECCEVQSTPRQLLHRRGSEGTGSPRKRGFTVQRISKRANNSWDDWGQF